MATICIRIVADFKAQTFQFITKLCTKMLPLNLALKPLLFLYFLTLGIFRSVLFIRFPFKRCIPIKGAA